MEVTHLDNDIRGWIMTIVSGIACVFGSSIICVDILVRRLRRGSKFKIEDSNAFLASSLSLSFGVMSRRHSRVHSFASHRSRRSSHRIKSRSGSNGVTHETTPLLHGTMEPDGIPGLKIGQQVSGMGAANMTDRHASQQPPHRRPSLANMQNRVISFVKDIKSNCDSSGPCYGYSDPCGQECFKHLAPKVHSAHPVNGLVHTWTENVPYRSVEHSPDEVLNGGISPRFVKHVGPAGVSRSHSLDTADVACESEEDADIEVQHHHHVPENAFMSIGLQTSIAIALHKLPEGFITYATNHVNPNLGFAVFMALFIHNITEGFALALPLYLALGSRWRAMSWSSLLGGLSQPLGAAVAAAWFKFAGRTGSTPGSVGYGCMFAVTAGIMTSVALSLFVESLSFNHNRNLCMAFAFMGMTIMGLSNALTAR
ncbi:hypothetical protein B7463_g7166, partial [Scytalidium lignicola]